MDGILNVNKPPGMTSHDVVDLVRRLSCQRRVGHAGTLDPGAEGVLVVCLGKATRVVEYLVNDRKTYRAVVTLGVSTDTYDAEGRVVARAAVAATLPEIEEALSTFRGAIDQVPPRYSALKQGGQPLYKLARTGREIVVSPRRVIIFRLEVLTWEPPLLTLEVECSKGTYVRSIAHDLGQLLGCGGHLSHLVRLASGRFALDGASTIEMLSGAFARGEAEQLLFALDTALLDFDALLVSEDHANAVRNGVGWPAARVYGSEVGETAPVRVYSGRGEIVAMVDYRRQERRWQPAKVF